MDDKTYIEGLAKILLRASPELELSAFRVAQRITDWHREQGLLVVPKRYVRLGIMALDKKSDENAAKGDGDE